MIRLLPATLTIILLAAGLARPQANYYNWLVEYDSLNSIYYSIPVPEGFERTKVQDNSFAGWLRYLPLKIGEGTIYTHDGRPVTSHHANFAVLDIDTGEKDLQQCADAIIRLRAEYLFSKKFFDNIAFDFTSGDRAHYSQWLGGYRPVVKSNSVEWKLSGPKDSSYQSFREYLDTVFMYAGTYSLSKEMKKPVSADSLQIGDAFILGGFPGHAVMVADMAVNTETGQKMFLLVQGFTPAQDIHVIKNVNRDDGLPWFELKPGDTLEILYWKFTDVHLRRF